MVLLVCVFQIHLTGLRTLRLVTGLRIHVCFGPEQRGPPEAAELSLSSRELSARAVGTVNAHLPGAARERALLRVHQWGAAEAIAPASAWLLAETCL